MKYTLCLVVFILILFHVASEKEDFASRVKCQGEYSDSKKDKSFGRCLRENKIFVIDSLNDHSEEFFDYLGEDFQIYIERPIRSYSLTIRYGMLGESDTTRLFVHEYPDPVTARMALGLIDSLFELPVDSTSMVLFDFLHHGSWYFVQMENQIVSFTFEIPRSDFEKRLKKSLRIRVKPINS